MALVDDFKTRFPEFATAVVDSRVPIFEAIYPCYFVGDYTVSCDKEAILNLIAHLLVMDTDASASSTTGTVSSKSVGSVSVSYQAPSDQSSLRDFFGGTKYGMMFLKITSHRHGAVFV